MAPSASDDAATRARITAHMNASHTREMSRYLRHFLHLPEAATHGAEMADVSTDGMLIKAGGRTFTVPFEPPLASLAGVRERVVAMDAEARTALGISDITLTEYAAPTGVEAIIAGSVVFYFVAFFALPLVQPGTGFWELLDAVFPGGPGWYRWVVSTIFVPVLGIHVTEAWWMHETRLVKHSVEPGSALWWKWVGNTFVEGATCFQRLDRIIEQKTKEKAAKKH